MSPITTDQSLAALADGIIDDHHAHLWQEMKPLRELVDLVASVHGSRHAYLVRVQELFGALVTQLGPHLVREEHVVFPGIVRLERSQAPVTTIDGALVDLLDELSAEHDEIDALLQELRHITSGYSTPSGGCRSYRAMNRRLEAFEQDLQLHLHKENNILLARARDLARTVAEAG